MLTAPEAVRPFVRVVTPPSSDPLDLSFVRDLHLRAAAGDVEDAYVSRLISTAHRMAERVTRRAIMPQTLELVLPKLAGRAVVVIPRPPVRSIVSFAYVDQDGAPQTLDADAYLWTFPTGPEAGYGVATPLWGESWPAGRSQVEGVVIRYLAGYENAAAVPQDITHGMLLIVGELYKQRSESVHAFNQNPALIRARDLFHGYRVY